MNELTFVFLCLHAPHAVDIFRAFETIGDGDMDEWCSEPSDDGRGAIGKDM